MGSAIQWKLNEIGMQANGSDTKRAWNERKQNGSGTKRGMKGKKVGMKRNKN